MRIRTIMSMDVAVVLVLSCLYECYQHPPYPGSSSSSMSMSIKLVSVSLVGIVYEVVALY